MWPDTDIPAERVKLMIKRTELFDKWNSELKIPLNNPSRQHELKPFFKHDLCSKAISACVPTKKWSELEKWRIIVASPLEIN